MANSMAGEEVATAGGEGDVITETTDNVLVAVRVRPMPAESRSSRSVVAVDGKTVSVSSPKAGTPAHHSFTYDRCYPGEGETGASSQEFIFSDIGEMVLDNAVHGFNVTVVAYGQTGSGKSYTMMGSREDHGLIPRICQALFERAENASRETPSLKYRLEASFLEIYCERVKDLLDPENLGRKGGLTIREHPTTGPYCEDLSVHPVKSFKEVRQLMQTGNSARTVAATKMNATSSRSHAIFTLKFTQTVRDDDSGLETEKMSKIHLVDLAGSERTNRADVRGKHLKEANEINKSLVTLGRVIKALAESASRPRSSSIRGTSSRKGPHIPFRDSSLTWFLKGSFGLDGNSRTIMICMISPLPCDYDETVSTLRYASNAKKVVTKAMVNDDNTTKLVSQLRHEISTLSNALSSSTNDSQNEIHELRTQLEHSQKLVETLNMSWEDKVRHAEELRVNREQALLSEGIAVKFDPNSPFLCNLDEDPSQSECLVYYLKPGRTSAGSTERAGQLQHIHLNDLELPDTFCDFVNEAGVVFVLPKTSSCVLYVNGDAVTAKKQLQHGDRLILGKRLSFRFNGGGEEAAGPLYDWRFAQDELKSRLQSVELDLQLERDQVRRLTDSENRKDEEMAQLRQQREQERTLFEVEFEGMRRRTQEECDRVQRELEETKAELQRQQKVCEQVQFESRMTQMQAMQRTQTLRSSAFYSRPFLKRLQALLAARKMAHGENVDMKDQLRTCIVCVDEANALAHALGHEVMFDLRAGLCTEAPPQTWLLSPLTQIRIMYRAHVVVLMKTAFAAPVQQTTSEFFDLLYQLRELYATQYEYRSAGHRRGGYIVDPVEKLRSIESQRSLLGFTHLWLSALHNADSNIRHKLPLFGDDGRRIGILLLTTTNTSSDAMDTQIHGVVLFETQCQGGVEVMARHWKGETEVSVMDVRVLNSVRDGDWDAPCSTISFSLEKSNVEFSKFLKSTSISFHVFGHIHDAEFVLADADISRRHLAFESVSVLKTPQIGADGHLSAPGPSERCSRAKLSNTKEVAKQRRKEGVARSPSMRRRVTEGNTLYLTIGIEELDRNGKYVPCGIKSRSSVGCMFRLSLDRPKRFTFQIAQSDNHTFVVESCCRARVSGVRCGPDERTSEDSRAEMSIAASDMQMLTDAEEYPLDIVQQNANVHQRFLGFTSSWPLELSHHSYIARSTSSGTRIYIDMKIDMYITWHDEPITIERTLVCKAYTGVGKLRSFLKDYTSSSLPRFVPGVYCHLLPGKHERTAANLTLFMQDARKRLYRNVELEMVRQHLMMRSPNNNFAKSVLDLISLRPSLHARLAPRQVSATLHSTLSSTIDVVRRGYLVKKEGRSSKVWKRFFFVLRPPLLLYFKTSSATKLEGVIDLVGSFLQVAPDGEHQLKNMGLDFDGARSMPIKAANLESFTLVLRTRTRTHELQANCREDYIEWKKYLDAQQPKEPPL